MSYKTLISTSELDRRLESADCVIVDCRFSLDDTERGRRDYLKAHIPGAVYAHLDEDLSGPVIRGKTGRHPLPTVERFSETLSEWGISGGVQVVAYDDASGAMAARLWWMLRWMGHDAVAVLDGGWQQWQRERLPIRAGREDRQPSTFQPQLRLDLVLSADDVFARLNNPAWRIVDSRAPERYRGVKEPIDPVAGHIPGAVNAPHPENIDADGLFKKPDVLHERFRWMAGSVRPEQTVFYCGSGVTAAHNVLAFAHAGLGEARLYAGSWSEWITDIGRPIATGG